MYKQFQALLRNRRFRFFFFTPIIDNDKSIDDKIYHILKDKITIGEFITKDKAVHLITESYRKLGKEQPNIKGTVLNKWFEVAPKYKRIEGISTYGFIIESPKVIYK